MGWLKLPGSAPPARLYRPWARLATASELASLTPLSASCGSGGRKVVLPGVMLPVMAWGSSMVYQVLI